MKKIPSIIKSIISDLTSTNSLLPRLVAVFMVLIILPVTTIGIITTKAASNDLLKQMEDSISTSTLQTSNCFDQFLDKALNVSVQMIADPAIQQYSRYMDTDSELYEKFELYKDANTSMMGINSTSNDVNAMIIYSTGEALGDLSEKADMDAISATDWYQQVIEGDGKAVWIDYGDSLKVNNPDRYAPMSLLRIYKHPNKYKVIGISVVSVNKEPMIKVLSSVKLGENDNTYLLTPQGKVMTDLEETEAEGLSDRQFIKETLERLKTEDSGTFLSYDNDTKCLVSYHRSKNTGVTVVTTVPEADINSGPAAIARTTLQAGILFTVFAVIFGFIFSLRLTNSMKAITNIMYEAEKGNLTVSLEMKRKDEIGKLVASFNSMIANIRALVHQSKDAAANVAESSQTMLSISSKSSLVSNDVANAMSDVAQGASNQAAEIESSVENVKQLTERIAQTVEKTRIMEADSEAMKRLSDNGIEAIKDLSTKTEQTNSIAANVVKEITELSQYVKNIDKITNILRGIADQTNLLSLNAEIEAARAGNAGVGFAVVADEIRKLAERSNKHTKDIQLLLENINRQAQSSVRLVNDAENAILEQSSRVTETAGIFTDISNSTQVLSENIGIAGELINEMNIFKEKVLASMENISAVSEQVSASTQEVSASTEEQLATIEELDRMSADLSQMAEDLIEMMGKFTI
ncbi:MAG: methyl-accepting chemotaxis protein [Clostridiaceae bacterium]|nr:methyl-accepting chemotaxis protein [Clostridiaceae bacterium]